MSSTLAIVWPIAAFVMLGLEHSLANMYLIPAGWAAGADVTLSGYVANLVMVSLGNVVGGAGGVAISYRLAYGADRLTKDSRFPATKAQFVPVGRRLTFAFTTPRLGS